MQVIKAIGLKTLLIIMVVIPIQMIGQTVIEETDSDTIRLWIEDEAGNIMSLRRVFESGTASGGQFIELTPGNNNLKNAPEDGLTTYNFTVKEPGTPKKVIFETDMCLDVDDVGALAVLHAMANNDEVELLAVCFNEVHPYGPSAIDAINTWYGRGDIPVGIYKDTLSEPDSSRYLKAVSNFSHDLNSKNALSALDVYQNVLSEQPDSSVTIISVGFLNNLNDLLKVSPDLIAKKIKELVIMGGVNNDGFNLSRHNLVSVSENVIKSWPGPVVISQPGSRILTGIALKNSPEENPVREAYYKFFQDNFCGRPSWDQIAVLYGVRGLSNYFSRNTTGTGSLTNGYKWQMKPGFRSFIEPLLPVDSYAKIIDALMLKPPMN